MPGTVSWAPVDGLFASADLAAELKLVQAEAMGWVPLVPGSYLHRGEDDLVVEVVGIPDAGMADMNVLLLG